MNTARVLSVLFGCLAAVATSCTSETVSAPTSTEVPASVASVVPHPTSTPTPTPIPERSATLEQVPVGPGGAGLLVSLPLDPGAIYGVSGSEHLGGSSFLGYGAVYVGAGGRQVNPQPTFWAPLGTAVLAPITGTVVAIPVLWSGDFSIMISANGSMDTWVWETEHVIGVNVDVGDRVSAGQSIAVVSDYDERYTPGVGLVELGLLEGGNPPKHHCPFEYVAPSVEIEIFDQIRDMLRANKTQLGITASDIAALQVPGCTTLEPIEG